MKVLSRLIPACYVATMILLAGCQKVAIAPVALEATDMCSFCRMSISEARYAAELIDNDGQAFKFDEIGCMANFIKQRRNNSSVRVTFVMDFESREWLPAESAAYVRSAEFKTPMNGGIVAFRDKASAESAVAKYHGTLMPIAEVMK